MRLDTAATAIDPNGKHVIVRDSAGGLEQVDYDWLDQISPVADRVDHGVRVLGEAGRVVVARKIRGHRVVAPVPQVTPRWPTRGGRRPTGVGSGSAAA